MGIKDWFKRKPAQPADSDGLVKQLEQQVYRRPLERLEAELGEPPQGLVRWYLVGLALATRDAAVSLLIRDDGDQVFQEIVRPYDEAKIDRLSTFLAWWLAKRTLEDHPEIYANEDGLQDETSRAILGDLTRCREIMYATSQPQVADAIASYQKADQDFIDEHSTSFATLRRHLDAIDTMLGATPIAFDARTADEMKASVQRSISLSATFGAYRSSVKEYLDQIMASESRT
jgi:hypothetical protein